MRNRLLTLLLLPAIAVIWIIGWSLYWLGDQPNTRRRTSKKEPENVQITVNLPQEQEILE